MPKFCGYTHDYDEYTSSNLNSNSSSANNGLDEVLTENNNPSDSGEQQDSKNEEDFSGLSINDLKPDAGGFRVNLSGGYIIGANGSVDLIYNLKSHQFNIFVSIGPQGLTEGGSFTLGPLVIWNLQDNKGYEGWSVGANVTGVPVAGIEINITGATNEYKGERPIILYIGVGGGEEATIPLTSSYAWNIDDIFKFVTNLLK